MKKSLLIAVAALFVTVSASAQKVHKMSAQSAKRANVEQAVKMQEITAPAATPVAKPVQGRRAEGGIYTDYLMNYSNWEGDFTASTTFTIEQASGTIQLYAPEGQDPESFDYNLKIDNFTTSGMTVYGFYNEEGGYIQIPVQNCGNSKTVFGSSIDYGDIIFSGCVTANGVPQSYGFDMVLMVNADGTLEFYPFDFSEEIAAGDLDEGSELTGWYNFLTEADGAWNYGFEAEFFIPNATLTYTTTGRGLGGNGSSWQKVVKRVFIEDFGTDIVINGFLGLAPVTVEVGGDGTCRMPFGQEVDDYDYGTYDPNDPFEYGRMRLVGCYIDGNSIGRDYDKEYLNGFEAEGVYEFYKVEYREADGENEAGYYYVDEDPDYVRYYAVATANNPDPENGGAYSMGWCCNTYAELDEPTGGISTLKIVPETATDNKVYTIDGKLVDSNYRGLVIKNGKKVIVK